MTRLVIFENTLPHALADEVNAWLAEHPNVMPEDVQYRVSAASEGEYAGAALMTWHHVAIAYEDMAAAERRAA